MFWMRNMGIIGDDYYFIYIDELYPKGLLTPRTPTTPPVILGPPLGRLT